ncbi:MAG: alpha/beta fold hydrolase [Gemmatimonadaceae bacterium]|nr:alpha/beta fold hydrolase [Gemmatimonadaceae bacterium]
MSLLLRLSLLMAMTASLAGAQTSSIKWTPFVFTSSAGDTLSADSARVSVPENRSRPGSARISLAVVRVRSTAARPGAPIIYLAGGPGGAGIGGVRGDLFPTVAALRTVSDVILFDQRGTGATLPSLVVRTTFGVPLNISSSSPEAMQALIARSTAAAAEVRGRGIDLTSYNTVENADDVDDLRKALGANKLILWGHSYGSHLGLAYLRRHEPRVERAILGGINGLDHRRRFPRDADALFSRIDSIVKATPKLRGVMPDFVGTTRRVFARLATNPAMVRVDSQEILVSKEDVQAVIAVQSGNQSFVQRLPWIIGRLDAGDYSWMALQVRDMIKNRQLGTIMTYPMDLASGVSTARARQIREEARTAILGNAINYPFDDPAFRAVWTPADLGPQFRTPVRSKVPALFISGTLDGRTSLGDAEEVRKGFRKSSHVILAGAAHTPYALNPAIQEIMVRFARGEEVRDAKLRAANVELRGPDEPQLIEELRALVTTRGVEAAIQRLREMAGPASSHYLSSFVVSGLFQSLVSQNREAAAAVLSAGLELFPANTFLLTRLAEVDVAKGDKTAAIAAYQRAVAADPFNRAAAVQLAKLQSQ